MICPFHLLSRLVLCVCLALLADVSARAASVRVLTVQGAISPASGDYLLRGIQKANDEQAQLIVIEMDTPGGLDTSMRDIIKAILSSRVPVATYVSPQGARAASAGTYILYASHIAAMAGHQPGRCDTRGADTRRRRQAGRAGQARAGQ